MKHKILVIGAIASLIYLLISPFRWYTIALVILFGAYTIYRYIIFRAEQDAQR